MFEDLINQLKNTVTGLKQIEQDNKQISITFLQDADGYLDRECPNADCLFQFKVNEDDWKNLFKDEQVFCPMCRHEAKSTSWWNTELYQKGKEQVIQHVRKQVRNAISGKSIEKFDLIPIQATTEMTLKITCKECKSRYSVIGSAFFCPCCGNNSVEKTFDESLSKVEIKLNCVPSIRRAIEESSKDNAEITCRSLIEGTLSDCVVAFQRFCEATFQKERPNEKLPSNTFQRLEDGSKVWTGLFKEGYHDWLTASELNRMNTLFQRRHLLSHTEGLVDEKYIQRANDSTYIVGQRIVVKENDITELLKLIRKVVEKIRTLNKD